MFNFLRSEGTADVLELIPWKQCAVIYLKCIYINICLLIKRFFGKLRIKLDKRFGIFEKLSLFRRISGSESSINNTEAPEIYDKPPGFLMDSNLGQHSFVKLKTCKLHFIETGKSLPVVLLIHGFPDCWLSWRYQIPELKNHYRVIVLDLKGFNDSEKPQLRIDYNPNKICEELKMFLEALDVQDVVIVGHNLGGLIGWIFASKYPQIVRKLVVVSAPHPNLYWDNIPTTSVINDTWCQFIQIPLIPERELHLDDNFVQNFFPHLQNNINCDLLGENGKAITCNNIAHAYKYIFSREEDWVGPLNYFRNFYFYRIREDVRIECPCLIITGNQDKFHRIESIIKSSDFCENATIKVIDGANHCPHQHFPVEFNKILTNYLTGNRSQPQPTKKAPDSGLVKRMMKLANPYQLAESADSSYQNFTNATIGEDIRHVSDKKCLVDIIMK